MIPNQWYPILESRQVRTTKPIGVTRVGERLVLWREADGRIACMPDRCPHRSAMLSRGKIRDGCIECPYHGLRFNPEGRCTVIPANGCDAPVPHGFDLAPHSVREEHGVIWYWYGTREPAAELPWISEIAELGGNTSRFITTPRCRKCESSKRVRLPPFPLGASRTIPGVGPRVDEFKAEQHGDLIEFGGILRHEKPGPRKQDNEFRVKFRFPGVISIKFGGIDIAYAFTPIDAQNHGSGRATLTTNSPAISVAERSRCYWRWAIQHFQFSGHSRP